MLSNLDRNINPTPHPPHLSPFRRIFNPKCILVCDCVRVCVCFTINSTPATMSLIVSTSGRECMCAYMLSKV